MENKIIVLVEFEDKGQDFLEWKIEMDPGMQFGKVINSDPFQNDIWTQFYVLNKPEKNGYLTISKGPNSEVIDIKYCITSITILENAVN